MRVESAIRKPTYDFLSLINNDYRPIYRLAGSKKMIEYRSFDLRSILDVPQEFRYAILRFSHSINSNSIPSLPE